jgi:DNA-binding IclR family transcriptional regulator
MEIQQKEERIKSIDKALDLLEFLSNNENEAGISEINKNLNMGHSTIHRILHTLKSRGYILQNPKTAKYRLGIKLFQLGCEVQNTKNLIKIIRPHLKELSKITNETANLSILEGKEVIYLDTIESSEILRTGIRQGTRLPAHCTALGKALLAFLDNEQLFALYDREEPLVSITSNSITSYDKLTQELKIIRKQGYAMDLEEFRVGINCLSCPIFDKDEKIVAAISITGPASRLTLNKMENDKHILMNISKSISENFLMW